MAELPSFESRKEILALNGTQTTSNGRLFVTLFVDTLTPQECFALVQEWVQNEEELEETRRFSGGRTYLVQTPAQGGKIAPGSI